LDPIANAALNGARRFLAMNKDHMPVDISPEILKEKMGARMLPKSATAATSGQRPISKDDAPSVS